VDVGGRRNVMADITRISVEEAYRKVKAGKALLVCAYNDDDEYAKMRLEGSIPLSEFDAHIASHPKEGEIIFYCA
jgi:rhodanese-related sulfurtransferase